MNICIVSTYDCTFEEFEAVVTESQDEVSAFISEWELFLPPREAKYFESSEPLSGFGQRSYSLLKTTM